MVPTARRSLNALTSVRFLAAMWVVIYHYNRKFRFATAVQEQHYVAGPHSPLDLLISQGHIAVDFFFLLSGFILAYTYSDNGGTLRGGARVFWVARVARIYPVYLLGLLLGLGPYLADGHRLSGVISSGLAHIFMLQAWLPQTQDWNQPSWSLSVEAFFYALFPVLLPLIARGRRRGLWQILICSWLAFALVLLALWAVGTIGGLTGLWWWGDIVRYIPIFSLSEFIAGTALGLLFVHYGRDAIPMFHRLTKRGTGNATVVLTLILTAVLIGIPALGFNTGDVDGMAIFAMPLLAALIYLLAFQTGSIAHALSNPKVVWLGKISYGVYILHWPIWYLLSGFATTTLHLKIDSFALLIVYLVLVVGAAGLSFEYIERPARSAIRARWSQVQSDPTVSAAR